MYILNLSIDRIITHQIFQRDTDGNIVEPLQSQEYTIFDKAAMGNFKRRVNDAIGAKSKAVEMKIIDQGPADLVTIIDRMADESMDDFAESSFEVACKLAKAQTRKNYPGGIVVIFLGTQGQYSKKMVGIIKAEIHSGYEKRENKLTKEISLKYVEELLLTPTTRLYKTVGFFEKMDYDGVSTDLSDKWTVMISDTQIGKKDGKAAAQYFYEGFAGCGYPDTSARVTKHFYEGAVSFIQGLDVTDSKKNELLNALTIYLKTDISPTASTSDFSDRYFDVETGNQFSEYMEDAGVPDTAFTKDTEHIRSKLRMRSINFSGNLKLTAPAEVLEKKVIIENIDGDTDESGTPAEWTQITIKDRISKQE